MKRSFKIFALILAFFIMFSSLVACDINDALDYLNGVLETSDTTTKEDEETTVIGDEQSTIIFDEDSDETTVSIGEETTVVIDDDTIEVFPDGFPNVDKNNYDSTFYLSMMPDSNPIDYYWIEEDDGSMLSRALYERQAKIKNYLGVEILASYTSADYNVYTEDFKTAVKNKSGGIDTLLTHVHWGVSGLISGGFLRPFGDLPGVNIDAEYWNQDIMKDLSVCDEYLLGFSDFNLPYTYVITYNADLLEKYDDALDKSVYQMVDDYEWTLQQFIDIAKLGYIDNGAVDKNQYGLTGVQWIPWCGFLESCGVNLVEMNNKGTYEISYMNDAYRQRTENIVLLLSELAAANYSCVDYMTNAAPTVPFETGRALMTLTSTYDINNYRNYEIEFGILPYPAYDTNQKEYRSLQWGGYLVVPAYIDNENMVGDTMEMLAFFSRDVKTVYCQNVAINYDDARMMALVLDSLCTDFGLPFRDVCGDPLFMLPQVTSGSMTLPIFYEGRTHGGNTSLLNFIKKAAKKY